MRSLGIGPRNIAMQLKGKILRLPGASHRAMRAQDDTIALNKFSDRVKSKNNPQQLAKAIKEKLEKEKLPFIEKIAVINGFINISIKNEWFVSQMERVLREGEGYGKSTVLQGKKILLEHTSPDPIKTMHVGHLRNNFLGMSMAADY